MAFSSVRCGDVTVSRASSSWDAPVTITVETPAGVLTGVIEVECLGISAFEEELDVYVDKQEIEEIRACKIAHKVEAVRALMREGKGDFVATKSYCCKGGITVHDHKATMNARLCSAELKFYFKLNERTTSCLLLALEAYLINAQRKAPAFHVTLAVPA